MHVPPGQRLFNSIRKRSKKLRHVLGARFLRRSGISGRAGDPEVVISLTTIAERVATVHLTIDSLLRQSYRPDKVVLWLNRTEMAGRPRLVPETVPEQLRRLTPRGLTIEWCDNLGPHCKLVPALRRFPGALIATADDDILYASDWLEALVQARAREPEYVHCHRAHRMKRDERGRLRPYAEWKLPIRGAHEASFDLFPTGVGGVLYAPGDLAPEVLNETAFRALCPRADDVWFKAMSLLRGRRCRAIPESSFRDHQCELKVSRRNHLSAENVAGGGNDRQIQAVAARYGVLLWPMREGVGRAEA